MKYRGSGKLWKIHLKEFGDEVETIWHELFVDRDDIIEFATFFSSVNDIVNATDRNGKKIWANLIPEKGIGSFGNSGRKRPETEEEKINRGKSISKAKKGKSNGREGTHHSDETKAKLAKQKGWKHSEDTKQKMRKPKGPMSDERKELYRERTTSSWDERRKKYGPSGRRS